MTIFKSAYDTKACEGFLGGSSLRKVDEDLVKADRMLALIFKDNLVVVDNRSWSLVEMPVFAHPFLFKGEKGETHVAVDVRAFCRNDPRTGDIIVTNAPEHSATLFRGQLNWVWIHDLPSLLRDVSPLPLAVYTAWISENVARRYALDAREQLDLAILSGIFYQSCFMDDDAFSDNDEMRIVKAVSTACRCKADDVLAILDQVEEPIKGIKEFCGYVATVVSPTRLGKFNVGLLYEIIKGTWFGSANAKEIVAVALEHPPTWLTVLRSAAGERAYKNSPIYRILERQQQANVTRFVHAVTAMVEAVSK
jgi:hypothetical protein